MASSLFADEIEQPFAILTKTMLLSSSLLGAYPKMVGPILLGRLIPFMAGSRILKQFINTTWVKGKSSLFIRFALWPSPHHACLAV